MSKRNWLQRRLTRKSGREKLMPLVSKMVDDLNPMDKESTPLLTNKQLREYGIVFKVDGQPLVRTNYNYSFFIEDFKARICELSVTSKIGANDGDGFAIPKAFNGTLIQVNGASHQPGRIKIRPKATTNLFNMHKGGMVEVKTGLEQFDNTFQTLAVGDINQKEFLTAEFLTFLEVNWTNYFLEIEFIIKKSDSTVILTESYAHCDQVLKQHFHPDDFYRLHRIMLFMRKLGEKLV